jgi:hypothetical protein
MQVHIRVRDAYVLGLRAVQISCDGTESERSPLYTVVEAFRHASRALAARDQERPNNSLTDAMCGH